MLPEKKVTRYLNHTQIEYRLPDNSLHREDGPASTTMFKDGKYVEEWYYDNVLHRYGGPALMETGNGIEYWVKGLCVTDLIDEWMEERDYFWETMNDLEKWELELFMRSL